MSDWGFASAFSQSLARDCPEVRGVIGDKGSSFLSPPPDAAGDAPPGVVPAFVLDDCGVQPESSAVVENRAVAASVAAKKERRFKGKPPRRKAVFGKLIEDSIHWTL